VSVGSGEARWEAELRALREELKQLRAEQRETALAVRELATTFRSLATHLGIAAEPYQKRDGGERRSDLPGFA